MLFNTMGRIITALEPQKHRTNRVNVHLDGAYAFSLACIVSAWLSVGRELSDTEIDNLLRDDSFEEATQAAMRFINYKPRTAAEVRKRLVEHKIPEAAIEHTLTRLTQTGLINDDKYARDWVESRQASHPRSARMIAFELRRKGIGRLEIETAMSEACDDDQQAYQLASQKISRYEGLEYPEFREKLGSLLARRGFSYEVATRTVNRLWSEQNKERKND
ncbi:MAG: RecX family transcriptional regulator [Anaerolineaceae bacterium]|nr:RecX family transcriptional regulator [Anaerolineaceae bacterium]